MFDTWCLTHVTPPFPSCCLCCVSVDTALSFFLPNPFYLLSCMIVGAFCTHLGLSQFHISFSTVVFNSCLIQCFQTYSPYVLFLCFQGHVSNDIIWKNQERFFLCSPSLDWYSRCRTSATAVRFLSFSQGSLPACGTQRLHMCICVFLRALTELQDRVTAKWHPPEPT